MSKNYNCYHVLDQIFLPWGPTSRTTTSPFVSLRLPSSPFVSLRLLFWLIAAPATRLHYTYVADSKSKRVGT